MEANVIKKQFTIQTTEEEIKDRIKAVLRDAHNGMDHDSLMAAVDLVEEIELLQATVRLLQAGKIRGQMDANTGEVYLSEEASYGS